MKKKLKYLSTVQVANNKNKAVGLKINTEKPKLKHTLILPGYVIGGNFDF